MFSSRSWTSVQVSKNNDRLKSDCRSTILRTHRCVFQSDGLQFSLTWFLWHKPWYSMRAWLLPLFDPHWLWLLRPLVCKYWPGGKVSDSPGGRKRRYVGCLCWNLLLISGPKNFNRPCSKEIDILRSPRITWTPTKWEKVQAIQKTKLCT